MRNQLVLVLVSLSLVGCGRQPVPQAPMSDKSKESPQAEVRIGGGQDETRQLPFKITAVHENRKPIVDPIV